MKSFHQQLATFKALDKQKRENPFRKEWINSQSLHYTERWKKEADIIKRYVELSRGKFPDFVLENFYCLKYMITGEAFNLGWGFECNNVIYWKDTKREIMAEWMDRYNHTCDYLGPIKRVTMLESMLYNRFNFIGPIERKILHESMRSDSYGILMSQGLDKST